VGIKMNRMDRSQSFYAEHTDDILSIAVSPVNGQGKQMIATGQIGARPCIEVWDASTMVSLCKLSGFHRQGVTLLAFTPCGTNLISVGLDDQHSIAVYSVSDKSGSKMGRLLYSSQGNSSKVLSLVVPSQHEERGVHFISCGVQHVDFWTVDASKGLQKKRGRYTDLRQPMQKKWPQSGFNIAVWGLHFTRYSCAWEYWRLFGGVFWARLSSASTCT